MRSYVYACVSARTGVAVDDRDQVHCVARRAFSSSWQEYRLPDGAGAAVAVACG